MLFIGLKNDKNDKKLVTCPPATPPLIKPLPHQISEIQEIDRFLGEFWVLFKKKSSMPPQFTQFFFHSTPTPKKKKCSKMTFSDNGFEHAEMADFHFQWHV